MTSRIARKPRVEPFEITNAGLLAGTDPVPLKGVRISALLLEASSEVTVTQRYKNEGTTPFETTYCFPLAEGSAVRAFSVTLGDREVRAEIDEREQAFKRYDDALAQGDSAVLLDQENPNIFVASVGNLAPGEEAAVTLTYVAELPVADEAVRLLIPTTVSPRYSPPGSDPVAVDRISPPTAAAVPFSLALQVRVREAARIAELASPSHTITVADDAGDRMVTLANPAETLDRDFVLSVRFAAAAAPRALAQRHRNGETALMLRFHPELESPAAPLPSETVFVVDCSGSMDGSSIGSARKVLELCLRALAKGDRFNIVRFGNTHQAFANRPRDYDAASLADAVAFCRATTADLGGTDLLPALEFVYSSFTAAAERRREIVLITDGEISNETEVLELARRHRDRVRIFAFGIGHGPSESLVRGLGRSSGGAAEFVAPGESVEGAVLRQFARLGTPYVSELKIDWGGLPVTRAPLALPPLFSGDSFTAYARLDADQRFPERVTLAGTVGGETVTWSAPVTDLGAGELVGTLWARHRIRDLEENVGADRGSRQRERKADTAGAEIIALGKSYSLMSSLTSFVGVVVRAADKKVTDPAEYVRVPIMLTRDWHGTGSLADSSFTLSSVLAECCMPSVRFDRAIQALPAPPPSFLDLLLTQDADGWFALERTLAKLIGTTLKKLRGLAAKLVTIEASLRERVLATQAVLVLLETRYASEKGQWSRAAAKAEKALAGLPAPPTLDGGALAERLAREFFPG